MVNFRIIENPNENLDEIYNDFKEDFLNPDFKVAELREKYDLSSAKYKHLRGMVFEETGLTQKPCHFGGPHLPITERRFIKEYRNGKCIIYKTIDGVKKSFGTYADLESAKYVRDLLVKYNWDEDVARDLKLHHSSSRVKPALNEALKHYTEFEELYLNGDTIKEITGKLGISVLVLKYQYNLLSQKVREKYSLLSKRQKRGD